jgi:hypothetical protein
MTPSDLVLNRLPAVLAAHGTGRWIGPLPASTTAAGGTPSLCAAETTPRRTQVSETTWMRSTAFEEETTPRDQPER